MMNAGLFARYAGMLLVVATLLIGCGGGGGDSPMQSADVQLVNCNSVTPVETVAMASTAFMPPATTIAVNDVIKWTNEEALVHTVTGGTPGSPDGKFDSGNLSQGSSVCFKFLTAGTYPYYCRHHFTMTGMVTVN